jgi:hypothetical protein
METTGMGVSRFTNGSSSLLLMLMVVQSGLESDSRAIRGGRYKTEMDGWPHCHSSLARVAYV